MKIVYLDTSIALRWVLRAPDYLQDFGDWQLAGSSALFETECYRTLIRLRQQSAISEEKYLSSMAQIMDLWDAMAKIPVSKQVLMSAKQPFISSVMTLDAIHAASAKLWRDDIDEDVILLSHDRKLNLIGHSLGFKTLESK